MRSSTDTVIIRCSHCCGSGVTVKDVDAVFSKTRHTTCISPSLGGSGNPSVITARGIVCAIKVPAFSPRYFLLRPPIPLEHTLAL